MQGQRTVVGGGGRAEGRGGGGRGGVRGGGGLMGADGPKHSMKGVKPFGP